MTLEQVTINRCGDLLYLAWQNTYEEDPKIRKFALASRHA